jgi:hypothetical protein
LLSQTLRYREYALHPSPNATTAQVGRENHRLIVVYAEKMKAKRMGDFLSSVLVKSGAPGYEQYLARPYTCTQHKRISYAPPSQSHVAPLAGPRTFGTEHTLTQYMYTVRAAVDQHRFGPDSLTETLHQRVVCYLPPQGESGAVGGKRPREDKATVHVCGTESGANQMLAQYGRGNASVASAHIPASLSWHHVEELLRCSTFPARPKTCGPEGGVFLDQKNGRDTPSKQQPHRSY